MGKATADLRVAGKAPYPIQTLEEGNSQEKKEKKIQINEGVGRKNKQTCSSAAAAVFWNSWLSQTVDVAGAKCLRLRNPSLGGNRDTWTEVRDFEKPCVYQGNRNSGFSKTWEFYWGHVGLCISKLWNLMLDKYIFLNINKQKKY